MKNNFVKSARLPRAAYPQRPLGEVLQPYMGGEGRMQWRNLRENKCPKCGKEICSYHFHPGNIVKHPCGFVISVKKFSSIVGSQVTADIEARLDKEYENNFK